MAQKPEKPYTITKTSNMALNAVLTVLALICILPLILIIAISFTDEQTLNRAGYGFIPQKFSLAAYGFIFSTGRQIFQAYAVTLVVTVTGTVLAMLISTLYAYVLSRKDFRYRKFFSFFIFFTMLFNGGLVSTYLVVVNVLHLRDTLWVLILPYLLNAWWVMILRTFITSNIPVEIIESAKIDGAGEFRIFFQIVFQLALPGIATIALFCTLQYWNDWWLPLLYINDQRLAPLPYLLYKVQLAMQFLLQNSSTISGGMAADILAKMPVESARMAMVIIGIGPVVIAFPFFQKHLVRGLTIGAVKG